MAAERILVVDDEELNRDLLQQILEREGYQVAIAANGQEALALLRQETFHVVLTDLKMPGMTGVEVIRELKTLAPFTMGIIHTAYGSVETAVEAMKVGAYDYVTKPVRRDELMVVIQRALEFQRLHYENVILRKQLKAKYKFDNIISDNEKMQAIFTQVEKVADTDSTVLIYGESGTGKELIARAIHYNSYRQDKPLVPINCGAIPEDLLESELFGHERGAFTGAIAQRLGRFELANGGTIFLDEVGDIPLELQPKLLRVLQEQQFERLGSTRTIHVDVRLVTATNRDLAEMVTARTFRSDLYYRLRVFPLLMPPLRDRQEDIPALVRYFVEKHARRMNRMVETIPAETLDLLVRYPWPGNIRELENLIERAVIVSPGPVLRVPLSELKPPSEPVGDTLTLRAAERDHILRALEATKWVLAGPCGAAARLGMKRTTLQSKMRKLGVVRGH